MADTDQKATVAYAPFKTFQSAIESLEHGVPQRIDASIWPSYSGAIRSQLLGAFKFLGLIDESGKPSESLKELVEKKVTRKATLRKILETSYPQLIGMNLKTSTPKQFDEAMRRFEVQGQTLVKATSFFLQAAKYSELPISPLLLERKRTNGARRQRLVGGAPTRAQEEIEEEIESGALGTSKAVQLESGLTLTVTVSGNFLDLTPRDREFVFGMIDKLDDYGKQQ